MAYCVPDKIYDLLKLLFRHADMVCCDRLKSHRNFHRVTTFSHFQLSINYPFIAIVVAAVILKRQP
jgi:hypothetical protein